MLAENQKIPNPRLIKFDNAHYGVFKTVAGANLNTAKAYADEKDAATLTAAKKYTDDKKEETDSSIGTLASESLKILTSEELTAATTALANGKSFFYLETDTLKFGKKAKNTEGEVTSTEIGKLSSIE